MYKHGELKARVRIWQRTPVVRNVNLPFPGILCVRVYVYAWVHVQCISLASPRVNLGRVTPPHSTTTATDRKTRGLNEKKSPCFPDVQCENYTRGTRKKINCWYSLFGENSNNNDIDLWLKGAGSEGLSSNGGLNGRFFFQWLTIGNYF